MAAAVASTTAVESATSVAAPEAGPAVTITRAVGIVATMSGVSAPVVAVAVVTAATIKTSAVISAVIPGTRADEDAAGEVARPVVAVRGTGVRIITIVTVSADGGRANRSVDRPYSNGEADLRVGAARGKKQNSEQSCIFKVTHIVSSIPAWAPWS